MTADRLIHLVHSPELLQKVLGNYDGPFSIGVGQDPSEPSCAAVVVHLQGKREAVNVPDSIELAGETLKVIKKSGFLPPKPL